MRTVIALCVAAWVTTATAQPVSDAIRAAVAQPSRSAEDRERDARDKPAELFAFAGIAPGMRVVDIFGGEGYYAELFSYAVGPTGRVLLVNNMPYQRGAEERLATRFANDRLRNVQQRVVEASNMLLPERSFDLAVITLSYHDLYYVDDLRWPAIDAERFFASIHASLAPGGGLLIVDHAAPEGSRSDAAQNLHRIDEDFAVADITSRGFALEKRWDGLRNTADDRGKGVFDPAVRGKTDRFVHLYRKR